MDENKIILSSKENIQNIIVKGNDVLVDELIKNDSTVYGIIVDNIEQNKENIDNTINNIAGYFAANKALAITREYEESRNLREKWIKNSPIKQKQMEIKREMATEMTSAGIQLVMKGGLWVVEKALIHIDNMEKKKSIWELCLRFANYISDGNISSVASLETMMCHIYDQMFSTKTKRKKNISFSVSENSNRIWIPSNRSEAERTAWILYVIYCSSHYMTYRYKTKERDFDKLLEFWTYMGIWNEEQEQLLKKFELLEKGNAIEYGRINTTIQSLYNNLSISVPGIDRTLSKKINAELLKYVPNGDKQLATRKIASFTAKSAIIAAASIAGTSIGSPALLTVAATAATSLVDDLSNTEVIGNCLVDSGIDQETVKKCIDEARHNQLPPVCSI